MTAHDYWLKQLESATHLAPSLLPEPGQASPPDPDIVAALLIAGQLRDIVTQLSEIRHQLAQLEDAIQNG